MSHYPDIITDILDEEAGNAATGVHAPHEETPSWFTDTERRLYPAIKATFDFSIADGASISPRFIRYVGSRMPWGTP